MDFQKGYNVICEENGWGKSTFAAFIRAMFYGFDGERKRDLDENERKRYMPWQGGTFGGKLVFETDGKKYVITRIFGEKEQKDIFELRDADTNLVSNDYTSNIGKELFKIDRSSFINTIFIGQNSVRATATDDIHAKIGNLTDQTNDMNCYEKADGRLKDLLNALTPKKVTGSVGRRKNEIAELERKVQAGNAISDSMEKYQEYLETESEKFEKIKEERKTTEVLQAKVSKLETVVAKRGEWERLKETESKHREQLEVLRSKFPGEIPTLEDVKEHLDTSVQMERVEERVSMYKLTDLEMQQMQELQGVFSHRVPQEADIDAKIEEAKCMQDCQQELATEQMSASETERLQTLHAIFEKDAENVSTMIAKWNARNSKKAALPSNKAALSALQVAENSQKQKQSGLSPLLLLEVAIVVASIAFSLAIDWYVGLAVAVIGTVIIIAKMSSKKPQVCQTENTSQTKALEEVIRADESYIENTDAEMRIYLNAHQKTFDEYLVASVLQELANEYMEYDRLKTKDRNAKNSTKTAEKEKYRKAVDEFLQLYAIHVSEKQFIEKLHALKMRVKKHLELQAKQKNYCEMKAAYQEKMQEVGGFLTRYGWETEENLQTQLRKIQEDILAYQNIEKVYNDSLKNLQIFEKENDSAVLEEVIEDKEYPSLDELNQKLQDSSAEMEAIRERVQNYNRVLEGLQEQYEEWEETKQRLEELKVIQEEEYNKYIHVEKAKVYLEQAKKSMTSKYAKPILDHFREYFEMITQDTTDKYLIDANMRITVEEHGMQREEKALSAGYKDLVGMCLRIALVDAMYQEEAPVLVMDDPFVNLDDAKVETAKKLLERIAEKYQILYFTCSNARR